MPSRLTLVLICIILILGFLTSFLFNEWKQSRNDNEDLRGIITVQEKQLDEKRFTDEKGRHHLKSEVTTINDPRNLKEDPELREILSSMEGKIKNLELLTTRQSVSHTRFFTYYKDSTINDTTKVKCIDWSDKWTSIKGCDGDTNSIFSYDTINETIYSERKAIPTIRIGKKYIRGPRIGKKKVYTEIVNSNPHVKIITNRTYKVLK